MARNILIDGSFLAPSCAGTGINRYLTNLLRYAGRIAAGRDGMRLRVLVPARGDPGERKGGDVNGVECVECAAMRLRRLWALGFLQYLPALKTGADSLFLPYPAPVPFKPFRVAVTIHDLIPLVFPEQRRTLRGRIMRYSYWSSARRADLVLTDSEYSRDDLVLRCRVPAGRIVVAYPGFGSELFNATRADADQVRDVLRRYGVDRPYVLHVGENQPRKNLGRLVRAYRRLVRAQGSPEFQLVLCGRLGCGGEDLARIAQECNLQGRVILAGVVPDSDLAILYKTCAAFAMPSLYEGFGLPLVEAMASGVPVIASGRSCLPEIGGDAAVYFNPESEEEMAQAMERILADSALRNDLVQKGLRRVKRFTWEECARKTLAALREL